MERLGIIQSSNKYQPSISGKNELSGQSDVLYDQLEIRLKKQLGNTSRTKAEEQRTKSDSTKAKRFCALS